MELHGKNYLLPIDFPPDSNELGVIDHAYSAQELLDKIESSGARVKLIVLDACRYNPLRATNRSASGGLVRMEGEGMLIMFATSAGKTATDSGVFERELVRGMQMPGIPASQVLNQVAATCTRPQMGPSSPRCTDYCWRISAFGRVPFVTMPQPQSSRVDPSQAVPSPVEAAQQKVFNSELNGVWRGKLVRNLIDGEDALGLRAELTFNGSEFTGQGYERKISVLQTSVVEARRRSGPIHGELSVGAQSNPSRRDFSWNFRSH